MNRATFRNRIERPEIVLLPGVANPLSALIAADLGFEALYVTGAGVSNFNLGLPDIGLLTLDDVCAAVSRSGYVVDLPLIVDADTGFGNAVNVHHTVRRLEAAGAAAIQLEDQVFPKKCGHFDGKGVIAAAEMVDKIAAAVDARHDSDLLIVARTDACATHGFDAAVERAARFAEAGADILFVEAVTSAEDVARLPTLLDRPQIMNIVFGGKTPARPLDELERLGFRFALYANAALQGAMWGMRRVLGELREEGSLDGAADYLASFAERQRIIDKDRFDALEARFAAPQS